MFSLATSEGKSYKLLWIKNAVGKNIGNFDINSPVSEIVKIESPNHTTSKIQIFDKVDFLLDDFNVVE